MWKYCIEGKHTLNGSVRVQGAKNSVLPIMAASILSDGESQLYNCPDLLDVTATVDILKHIGCNVSNEDGNVLIRPGLENWEIPHEMMRRLRSSIVFLGALLQRFGKARLSLPGGCELGPRPIDLHLSALRQMGVIINENRGYIDCDASSGVHGAKIALKMPSVGATENILILAAMAEGETEIANAAREPEIVDLANYLNACGAKIQGAGESTIYIQGVKKLHGAAHRIIPDRIVAATYMGAVAAAGGDVLIEDLCLRDMESILPYYEEMGCQIRKFEDKVRISRNPMYSLKAIKSVKTMPHPGFPTDAQPILLANMCASEGTSTFIETIFENRFRYAGELARMGASILVEAKVAVVEGSPELFGSNVMATDLRGGAALVIAALGAQGTTEITDIHHIARGYDHLEVNLKRIGAHIQLQQSSEEF